jgi:hypothetical protein
MRFQLRSFLCRLSTDESVCVLAADVCITTLQWPWHVCEGRGLLVRLGLGIR